MRRWQIAGLAAILIAIAALVSKREPSRGVKPPPIFRQIKAGRQIYPYSVIPGGVGSAMELRNALGSDSVAAAHYAGFRLDRTRVEHLDGPKKVFVSYRIKDKVYWTRNRLSLPKGEAILTDGTSSARTRCGNRLSETPQLPVNAESEPAPSVLESGGAESWQPGGWEGTVEVAEEEAGGKKGDFQDEFGPQSVTSMSGRESASAGWGSSAGGGIGGGGFGGGGGGLSGGGAAPGSPSSQNSRPASVAGAPTGSGATSVDGTLQASGFNPASGSLLGSGVSPRFVRNATQSCIRIGTAGSLASPVFACSKLAVFDRIRDGFCLVAGWGRRFLRGQFKPCDFAPE